MASAAELQALITAAYNAQLAILQGQAQSVSVMGKTYTALNLNELEALRKGWEAQLAGISSRSGIFRPIGIQWGTPST